MNHCESAFESCVKSLFGGFLLSWCPVLDDGFRIFYVDVAKMVVPILVCYFRCLSEFAGGESGVDLFGRGVELMEYPELRKGFVAIFCGVSLGFE